MRRRFAIMPLNLALVAACGAAAGAGEPIAWKRCLGQKAEWYGSDEAVRIADNVLLYQRDSGGWPKNQDMARALSAEDAARLRKAKSRTDSTLDNGATHTQMRYLARVYAATKAERFKDGFVAGMDAVLRAQYANGGWPQCFPDARGYHRHITFNDGAMVGVMTLLRDAARRRPEFGFVDDVRRAKARRAVAKGIDCILKCQIRVKDTLTAWCAQHDEETLEPRGARSYEKPSISGSESVGAVRFLMGIEDPGPEVVASVQAAVAWFDRAKLTGIRQISKPDASKPGGYDKVIVPDPAAPPLWARFYEIGTNRPIFCSRDGIVRYRLAEISHERRTGYAWYVSGASSLLATDYPKWQRKHAAGRSVLPVR